MKFVQESLNDAPHPQTYSLIDDKYGALEKTGKTFNVTLGDGKNKKITKFNEKTIKPTPAIPEDKNNFLVASKC